jgi:hypothetical protein
MGEYSTVYIRSGGRCKEHSWNTERRVLEPFVPISAYLDPAYFGGSSDAFDICVCF